MNFSRTVEGKGAPGVLQAGAATGNGWGSVGGRASEQRPRQRVEVRGRVGEGKGRSRRQYENSLCVHFMK